MENEKISKSPGWKIPIIRGIGCMVATGATVIIGAGLVFFFLDDISRGLTWVADRAAGVNGKEAVLPAIIPENRTIGDLIQHFQRGGLKGKFVPGSAASVGAKDGGGYEGDGFSVFVYLFDDTAMADSREKSGMYGKACHRNGRFIMIVFKGEDLALPLFKQF